MARVSVGCQWDTGCLGVLLRGEPHVVGLQWSLGTHVADIHVAPRLQAGGHPCVGQSLGCMLPGTVSTAPASELLCPASSPSCPNHCPLPVTLGFPGPARPPGERRQQRRAGTSVPTTLPTRQRRAWDALVGAPRPPVGFLYTGTFPEAADCPGGRACVRGAVTVPCFVCAG